MKQREFYDRPMVRLLSQIFDHPEPPRKITERQFDEADHALRGTARKPWHEIDQSDYWHYLLDLCYVDLQQDLFDYLFPAFLVRWWEGLRDRSGGLESECDFYRAIDHGQVLEKMMVPQRRDAVKDWMIAAYVEAVDCWSGHLDVVYKPEGPDNLHGPLWALHGLGQSVQILPPIWKRLEQIETPGRAQWWLVFATGIAYSPDACPHVPPWTSSGGGGGVYVLESAASIYDHGYLSENLDFVRGRLSLQFLIDMLERSIPVLSKGSEAAWAEDVKARLERKPDVVGVRLQRFLMLLAEPDLGGVLDDF